MKTKRTKLAQKDPQSEEAQQCESCEECGEEGLTPQMIMQINQDQNELDTRGIIVINQAISKPGLERATERLLCLHFDDTFNDEIQIILNSPGGYVDAGWAFIDLMNWIRHPVRTIAVGEICSMATSIFIAGDYRVMTANSAAMIHQFSSVSAGTYADLVASRKSEDMEHEKNIQHLISNSKYTKKEEIEEFLLLTEDNWITPKEMMGHGLADHLVRKRNKASKEKKASLTGKKTVARPKKVLAKKKVVKKKTKKK